MGTSSDPLDSQTPMVNYVKRSPRRRWWAFLLGVVAVSSGAAWFIHAQFGLGISRGVSVVGLCVDILGVWVLAQSVLLSEGDIESSATAGGLDQRVHLYSNRADGRWGLGIVAIGFVLQVAGNLLQ